MQASARSESPKEPDLRPRAPRSFKRAFASTFAGNLALQGIGIVTGIVAARILGRAGRGELAAVVFYPSLFVQFGILGVQQATAYEVSRRPQEEGAIVRSAAWLAVALGIVLALFGVAVVPFLMAADKSHLTVHAQWFMVYAFVALPSLTLLHADLGAFRHRRYNVLRVLPGIIYVTSMTLIWRLGAVTVAAVALCMLGSHLLALAARAGMSARTLVGGTPAWAEIGRLLRRGVGFHLPQVAGIALARADMAIVLAFLPAEDVGLYAVALAVAMGQLGAAGAFIQVGFVKVAGEKDAASARASLLVQFRAAQVVTLAGAGVFLLIVPLLIRYALGEDFLPATRAARLLVGAYALLGRARGAAGGCRARGRAWAGAVGYLAGFSGAVAGGVWLVPAGGIDAMAAVMLAASALVLATDVVLLAVLERAGPGELWGLRADTLRAFIRAARNMWHVFSHRRNGP